MMTSQQPRDVGGSFASRRGHASQLSISDPSHHITETIGTLYGDDDDYASNESRPLSFIASPLGGEQIFNNRHRQPEPSNLSGEARYPLVRSTSDNLMDQTNHDSGAQSPNGNIPKKSQTLPGRMPSQRNSTLEPVKTPSSPMSPTLREIRNGTESSQFPLGSIENPNDIAQELNNLQALRRMSMDVSNNSDPDLLPFQGASLMAMPSVAPSGDDDEADPSRLLWVPAGVHPELAPTEFKNFLEKRVASIRRRSTESSLSVDSSEGGASSGLSRKKSMLSRQITGGRGADGYEDGADRLERQRSGSLRSPNAPELSLDELVKDPSKAVQKLTLESQKHDGDDATQEDMPILPVAPGTGLRRSTRTTYRKGGSLRSGDRGAGSVRSGDRLPFSRRMASRRGEGESEEPQVTSPIEAPPGYGLNRVHSEPISSSDNYSLPNRSVRRQQGFSREPLSPPLADEMGDDSSESSFSVSRRPSDLRRSPSAEAMRSPEPVPQIIETPAIEEEPEESQINRPFPARSSSQRGPVLTESQPELTPSEPQLPARSGRRPNYSQQNQSYSQAQISNQQSERPTGGLIDMAQNPAPLPGGGATRTDSLTFIPTMPAEERKPDKKSKKDKSDSDSILSTKSTSSWKWFKSDDKDKKKKAAAAAAAAAAAEEEARKAKSRSSAEKTQDNARLDVLQNSIDTAAPKGRESLLFERDNMDVKLDEERRKEEKRKTGDPKKEKDGLFASFFGGGKKKGDRDSGSRKSHSLRPVSPEPEPYMPLLPDVDYHWTRFPILEERAIYRMAHIKLANPRRALYSQVLLSNFMYSYLAKVQAMHPQLQVPQSPQQKRLQEEERRRREEEEQQYMDQNQGQDSIDQYNFEYHRATNQYGEMMQQDGDYPEDAEIYDYDHSKDMSSNEAQYQAAEDYGQNEHDYHAQMNKDYYYDHQGNGDHRQGQDDMW